MTPVKLPELPWASTPVTSSATEKRNNENRVRICLHIGGLTPVELE
jgi:hypothetical protein